VASGQQGITLDGTGSYFMNGTGSMSYSWQQIYGTTVTLSNATSAQAGFTAPTVTSVQLLGFRLTVSSANGSTFDEVYLVVMP
jgi:chitinase